MHSGADQPTLRPGPVAVDARTEFVGWALLDRGTGEITGSANMATGTSSTESMIKAWIAADHLRQSSASGDQPDAATLDELRRMIIDSDDPIAQKYYQLGGGDAVVRRLISTCGLTGTSGYPSWWSRTQMTPQDAVRMGACIADSTAAGPTWTPWLLSTMRAVRGSVADQQATSGGGRWGIIDGLPKELAAQTAIKNGWTPIAADGLWHVSCLAIHPDWVLVVMTRYPIVDGLQYGADIGTSVARQLVHPRAGEPPQ